MNLGMSVIGGLNIQRKTAGVKEAARVPPEGRAARPFHLMTPSSLPTFVKAAMALSTCSGLWPAEIWTRISALPR